ncbi:MAG TPA: FAD-dependent monooxygenase [Aestuariivirga sp.]|nr:FAD-dependent monooxygenase [Aestuariivirga sp.]
MADSPFLIAGGGIAGLAAGLGLARIGKPSHIFERASSFDEIGAGLQLGPNAVRALQYLGAWDAVAPYCVSPAEIHVRDGVSGNILQRIPLGAEFENRFGAPYRVAHRADLQNALLESVRSKPVIKLQTNAGVTNVSLAETSLTLKSGKVFTGQAIIAADGVHSILRNLVTGQRGKKQSGHTLHRGLVPIGSIPASANADVVTLWLYPGGHVVHYAVSNGKHFNIVAAVEDSEISLGTAFQRACNPLAEILSAKIKWIKWPARDFAPAPIWTRNRTVLIGDAAHASLPYLAQGAAMALEDACVLSSAIQSAASLESAFQDFSEARFKRTNAIQKRSRQLRRIYHARGVLRQARNVVLSAMPVAAFARQLSWIYEWRPGGK